MTETNITISSYGEYSSGNYGVNAMRIGVGGLVLYFSYKTVVAYRTISEGLVICENVWGTTTGKHLNWINRDKSIRISMADFEKKLHKLLKKHKLSF